MSEQYKILEYPLIILFVVMGGALLMSSSDLITIFLAIELQSYGLYILCVTYRDSEGATAGGLTYFLLGGLSSCFILLASGLLYGNSGNTAFDGLYVINNITTASPDIASLNTEVDLGENLKDSVTKSLLGLYEYNYLNLALIIMSVGLLFKISAAPFHS
jgi:NADH-ubiquinone oxidoreductase chain 2